jgi:hypothetical protein
MNIINIKDTATPKIHLENLSNFQKEYSQNTIKPDTSIVDQIKQMLINLEKKEVASNEFILSSVAVPAKLNEIAKAIHDNSLHENNPEIWNSVIESAVKANNGLGAESTGFLTFSRDYGFVNTFNPNLSIEENKMLSQISLMKGIAIEDLPLSQNAQSLTNPEIQAQMQNIIQNQALDTQGIRNLTNPTNTNVNEKPSFFDKVKKLFKIGKNAYDKLKGIGKSVKGVAEKVRDFGGVLKDTGVGFIDKIGGYISKGAGFVSSLF